MDSDAEQRLDGNAAAGLLREVFAVELTAAIAVCEGCGRHWVVAELLFYGSALGAVLRCPSCDLAMIRLAHTPTGHRLDMRGVALLRIACTG
jgi:nucleotide-binding universal stress UspA family protein